MDLPEMGALAYPADVSYSLDDIIIESLPAPQREEVGCVEVRRLNPTGAGSIRCPPTDRPAPPRGGPVRVDLRSPEPLDPDGPDPRPTSPSQRSSASRRANMPGAGRSASPPSRRSSASCGCAPRPSSVLDGQPVVESVEWVPQIGLDLDLRLDGFALLMGLLVTGIGVLVFTYSIVYFTHERAVGRMAGLLVAFAGAMLGLVLSDGLLTLFVFWELTSITSFLLIGFDDRSAAARTAAVRALLVTGAGGLCLLAGLLMLGSAGRHRNDLALLADPPTGAVVNAALVLVLIGAVHQVGPVALPLLAAGRHGGPDPGVGLPALRHHGEGGHRRHRPVRAGVRRGRPVAADDRHRRRHHHVRRRHRRPAPAGRQARAGPRHGQPARPAGGAVRHRNTRGDLRRRRHAHRPRPVQGGVVPDRRHHRPRRPHPRPPPTPGPHRPTPGRSPPRPSSPRPRWRRSPRPSGSWPRRPTSTALLGVRHRLLGRRRAGRRGVRRGPHRRLHRHDGPGWPSDRRRPEPSTARPRSTPPRSTARRRPSRTRPVAARRGIAACSGLVARRSSRLLRRRRRRPDTARPRTSTWRCGTG